LFLFLYISSREKKNLPREKALLWVGGPRDFPERIAYLSRQGIDKEWIQDAFVIVELILFLSSGY
jgi:hypothetical protein